MLRQAMLSAVFRTWYEEFRFLENILDSTLSALLTSASHDLSRNVRAALRRFQPKDTGAGIPIILFKPFVQCIKNMHHHHVIFRNLCSRNRSFLNTKSSPSISPSIHANPIAARSSKAQLNHLDGFLGVLTDVTSLIDLHFYSYTHHRRQAIGFVIGWFYLPRQVWRKLASRTFRYWKRSLRGYVWN